MPIAKQVKIGGSYYSGHTLSISASNGDYQVDLTFTTAGAASSINLIPNAYGAGDTMKVEHLDADNTLVKTLVTDVPNIGKNASWELRFPALEKVTANEKIRVTYTNVAGEAMTLHVVLERIK